MQNRPLSVPQQNIWNMKKVFSDTTIANIGVVFKLFNYEFNPSIWKEAINHFIANNDAMRIRINDGAELTQSTNEFKIEDFEVVDISNLPEEEKQKLYSEWVRERLTDKLYKFRIVKYSENESGLFILKDHIITDAFSEGIMLSELTDIYVNLLKGTKPEINIKPSYEILLDREAHYQTSDKYTKDKIYWEEEFDEEPLLIGMSPKTTTNLSANRYSELLDANFTIQIKNFCQDNNVTPAVFFETLIFAYLKIISDENRITIGMPVLNRTGKLERTISGMFVNTLPFSINIPNDLDFSALSKLISSKKFATFRHQQYAFSDIQKDLKERFGYNGKLFDVVFSFQNASILGSDENVLAKSEWIPSGYADSGMLIHVDDRDGLGQYVVNLEYQIALFQIEEVKNILARLKEIAYQVFENKDILINQIDILSDKDLDDYQIFNNSTQLPVKKSIIQIFEEQVIINPDKAALIFGESCNLTYSELNRLANSLGNTISSYHLPKGSIIPIVGERSDLTIIALLAISKAGYAYCLLDTNTYPNDRIDSLIDTCQSKLFITYGNCDYAKEGIQCLNISESNSWSNNYENLNTDIALDDIFVILHTSGSSGIPKAVRISHEAAVNMGANNSYLIENCDYCVSLITMTFDAFTMDILLPLLNGRTLVLSTPDEQASLNLPNRLILKYPRVYTALTPTRLKPILMNLGDNNWENVMSLVIGGENFGDDVINLIRQKTNAKLYNSYGPTETTVFNCSKEIINNKVTVGRPVPNFKIHIMNKNGTLLPPGIIGEIVAIGTGVASGYLGEKSLTNEKFLIIDGQRAYRTGDYGYIDLDNELVFCGRKDNQYKINGVRFEANEIENLINLFEGITNSVIALKKHSGMPYVVAYYESSLPINEEELIEYLEQKLPSSTVPSIFIKMDQLPTTRTGKLVSGDKLPTPDFEKLNENNYVAPENRTQEILVSIWEGILDKDKVGINSTWKSLGGGSLDLLAVLDAIEKRFNIKIMPSDLPKSPTISFLDKVINGLIISDNMEENYDLDGLTFNKEPKLNDDVLLTGATGYLGSHLLYTLLKTTNRKVYCLVRDFNKFSKLMNFYFKDELSGYQDRIHLINGDIAEENLGLSLNDYETLKNNVSSVINAAANVKHYGTMDEFKGVNVTGVYNLLRFCAQANAKMHHVSTISVSGQGLTSQSRDNIVLDENCLDIGQSYKENVYIWTKYLGEKLVNDFRNKGLTASVYRVGHIANRYHDNLFQYNSYNSGFKLLVEAITQLKVLPVELETMELQTATVDDCARAITTLMENIDVSRTYHIYDTKIKNLSEYLTAHNISYERVDVALFMEKLESLIKSESKYSLILQYFKDMVATASNITVVNDTTNQILNGLGFYYQVPEGGSKSGSSSLLYQHSSKS